ncbi:MAG: efflux RND transporter periplasmic adaptor subunit [Gemmatimonadetes bacterium]|nr:efflux RND transporter periplasmic adaptor subunit [Gemmatimonadota bacterium]
MKHFGFLAFVALLGACGKAQSGGPGGGGPPPMPVEVVAALRDTVVDAIAATGQIEAIQSIELRPEVEGRIVEIVVREGQEVEQGQPLFRVDDAELRAQVARATADRDLAQQALERTKGLVAQNASSAADLERAEATARSTQAALDLLQIRLDRTVVRAPFSGVVGQRFVSLGDYTTSSTRLVTLQTVHPQRAVFRVPERYAARLARGQRVAFSVAALPGQEFAGTVDFVDPVVQLPARTILIKAVVPNPRRRLQPGMFIEAHLATDVRPNAVVVPEDGVLALQGATYAWVVVDGKAERREVTLGVRTPGFVEVRSGVAAGEQVVVGGQERLGPGTPVLPQVVNRGAGAAAEETRP